MSAWPQVMAALCKENLVSSAHVYDTVVLWNFGRLINNTDMHLGNLSLAIERNVFRLLPIYDMCSMGFAPKSGGEVPPYNFIPSEHGSVTLDTKLDSSIKKMAYDFWERVRQDERISDAFKTFLAHGNPIDLMESHSIKSAGSNRPAAFQS